MYKLTQPNDLTNKVEYIIRISDHTFIPTVDGNRDYEEYKEWINEGNEPTPAD